MIQDRVEETDHGISGEFNVQVYDAFQRNFRDKKMLATERIIKSGIKTGSVLEIGPGPGYLGLEWLSKTEGTKLTGIEISKDMIDLAESNARDYRLQDLVLYIEGRAEEMPFENESFDAVFTNGSLHEWSDPAAVFSEIRRVLVPGGRFFVSDLRRDVKPFFKWIMYQSCKPAEIRPGFITSLKAAYTVEEIHRIISPLNFHSLNTGNNPFGLTINGEK